MVEKLTSQKVESIFLNSLFKEGEDTSNYVKAEGITLSVGFNPERLDSYKPEIEAMLGELPEEFMESKGAGWSFLNACNDRNGNQWSGQHQTMEQLVLLGIAIGKVRFQLPKEMWKVLPGGMPYFVVLDS